MMSSKIVEILLALVSAGILGILAYLTSTIRGLRHDTTEGLSVMRRDINAELEKLGKRMDADRRETEASIKALEQRVHAHEKEVARHYHTKAEISGRIHDALAPFRDAINRIDANVNALLINRGLPAPSNGSVLMERDDG